MDYHETRSFRPHQSSNRYHHSMDAVNANGTSSSSQVYEEPIYYQDYVKGNNQIFDRGYDGAPEVSEQVLENALHKRGPSRGPYNRKGQTRAQNQRGKRFTDEKNSTSSKSGLEGEAFYDNDATGPRFDQRLEQKTRNYTPKGNTVKEVYEENFHDRRGKWRHEENTAKRGNTWRQRSGVNDRADRFYTGDEYSTSKNYQDAGHQDRDWRKTGVRDSATKDPEEGFGCNEINTDLTQKRISRENNDNYVKGGQSAASQRFRNEHERFKGGNFRDGDDYKPRRSDQGRNRGQQNKSGRGSKNAGEMPQRDSIKFGIQPVEEWDRPSADVRFVPGEYSELGDLQTPATRAESLAGSMDSRGLGPRKRSDNWRDGGQNGKPENCETVDGDLRSKGRRRGRRNRRGAFDYEHEGETSNRVESERGWQDVDSREDRALREGYNEEDGEGGSVGDTASRRERKDGRSAANYQHVAKDSKRQTRGRWDDGRYSADYNNRGGHDRYKHPQQGANWQRANGNDVQYGWSDRRVGVEQSVASNDHSGREERDRLKDASMKKNVNRDTTKSKDVEMGSSKESEIRSSRILDVRQVKRITKDKEDDLPRTASWQDETQRGRFL